MLEKVTDMNQQRNHAKMREKSQRSTSLTIAPVFVALQQFVQQVLRLYYTHVFASGRANCANKLSLASSRGKDQPDPLDTWKEPEPWSMECEPQP